MDHVVLVVNPKYWNVLFVWMNIVSNILKSYRANIVFVGNAFAILMKQGTLLKNARNVVYKFKVALLGMDMATSLLSYQYYPNSVVYMYVIFLRLMVFLFHISKIR